MTSIETDKEHYEELKKVLHNALFSYGAYTKKVYTRKGIKHIYIIDSMVKLYHIRRIASSMNFKVWINGKER